MNQTSKSFTLMVEPTDDGKRLDRFLSERISTLTRSQAKRLIEEDCVTSLSSPKSQLRPASLVEKGDRFQVLLSIVKPLSLTPEALHLDILYEDKDLIVVNKPAGMVVHPAVGNSTGTLVHALLAHCHDLSGIGGELKPGIVHRLDKGTSGVIIAAKNDAAHLHLSHQFSSRQVKKVYLALVYGLFRQEKGFFNASLGRSTRDRKKISSRTAKPKEALTNWEKNETYGRSLTFLSVTLHTGRTHQIRVHCAEAGHPLVGDTTYGSEHAAARIPDKKFRSLLSSLERPALHAFRLGIHHPRTEQFLEFTAPIPDDLKNLLDQLRSIAS
ncbi:MAG: hypothetical protein A3I05_08610 [Deltaproteobacteria bacterium RIFCSPLOWO2_02_FULL_44_10]|nr:MAG: hypothetical protein A3C46_00840 [Deltaproteobacteria bacterium RIFCSPHIGHO2_02_FULL_44_16]OGQ47653.1 MAG: hypothetical protein A3I05_08610 [Deltaproteobacteria bacterium RIFCSPLOWO2_02_FULL_44_10]